MKRLTFVLLAAALVLAGIVWVRAARLTSLQPAVAAETAAEPVPDPEGAIERYAGAIRIPTISHERVEDTDSAAFRALHDYLAASFPQMHETLDREVVGGLSLLFTWTGSDAQADPVVLMGHQDVVPVIPGTEDEWTHPPFSGVVADGFVWGRGTIDDKSSVLAILEAVEWLITEGFHPRRTVYLAFGHDEEVGGVRGARAISELLEARGAEPYAMVLDEGGAVARGMVPGIEAPVALVGIAEKGYVNVELTVEAPGGHSSAPPAHTSIGILARAITRMEDDPFPAEIGGTPRLMWRFLAPEMGTVARVGMANLWLFGPVVKRILLANPSSAAMLRTTTAVTIVEGGVKSNVLPIRARAVVNHRIRPGETIETVLERDRRVIDDPQVQAEILGGEGVNPSPVSDPFGPAFTLLARTIRELDPADGTVVAPYLVTGGTDAKYYAGRSPAVFRFLPAELEPDALGRIHGTDERTPVEGYLDSVRFFRRLLKNLDALP